MKNKLWYLLTLSALLAVSLDAMAARNHDFRRERPIRRGNERSERPGRVEPGRPNFGGNGCPAGTMSVAFAPDNLSFSIIFDQFVAETTPGMRRDVMTCDALIPITLPDNMQMQITRVDFRGFVALPLPGMRANLHSVFNFRGRGGDGEQMNLRYSFQGPVMDTYEISTDAIGDNQTETSPCGGTVQLRVFNQLQIVSRPSKETASVTIDSIDGAAHATYYVNWKTCNTTRDDRDPRAQRDPRNPRDQRDQHGPRDPRPLPGRR